MEKVALEANEMNPGRKCQLQRRQSVESRIECRVFTVGHFLGRSLRQHLLCKYCLRECSPGEVRVWEKGSEAGIEESKQAAIFLGWPQLCSQTQLVALAQDSAKMPRGAPTFQNSLLGEKRDKQFLSCFPPIACLSLVKVCLLRLCLPYLSQSVTWPLLNHQGAGVAQTVQRHRGLSCLLLAVAVAL